MLNLLALIVDCRVEHCFSNTALGSQVSFYYYVAPVGLLLLYLHWDSERKKGK